MGRRKRVRKKKKDRWSNRLAIIGITVVVASLAFAVNVKSTSMKKKDLEYQVKEAYVFANCNIEVRDKIVYYPIYMCAFVSDEFEYPVLSLDI